MKININNKELMARLFVERMKEKSEKEIRIKYADDLELKKDAEIDCLYYWLLSRLYVVADSRIPARPHGTITVKGQMTNFNKVLLTQGDKGGYESNYLPLYVEGIKFFDVIEKTLKIFNSLEEFSASHIKIHDKACEFEISF